MLQSQKGLCPVQQGLPKMNLLFPGCSSLEASHALLQTGCVDSCDFALPGGLGISLTWQGLEINNAEPESCAAGSTNWFLLLEVLLLNVGTLWE